MEILKTWIQEGIPVIFMFFKNSMVSTFYPPALDFHFCTLSSNKRPRRNERRRARERKRRPVVA